MRKELKDLTISELSRAIAQAQTGDVRALAKEAVRRLTVLEKWAQKSGLTLATDD